MNAISQLLVITPREIGGQTVDTVDGRELYKILEGRQYFTQWFNVQLRRFNFQQHVDFVSAVAVHENRGRTRIDYFFNLPAAASMANTMRTEAGSKAYRWLVDYQQKPTVNPVMQSVESDQPVSNNLPLVLSDITVRQDDEGRYCLNDLHKASGSEQKHRPKYWLESSQTNSLIVELEQELIEGGNPPSNRNQPVKVIKGGIKQGTYVVKELVYAYAMWISAAFHLKVIRTFDSVVMQRLAAAQGQMINQVIPADFVSRSEHERLQIDYHRKSRRYEFMIDNLRDQVSDLLNISHQYDVLLDETAIPIDEVSKQLNLPSSVIENALNRLGWIKRDVSHVDSRKILKISKDAHRREFALLDTIIKDGIPTDIVKLTRHGFLFFSGLISSQRSLIEQ